MIQRSRFQRFQSSNPRASAKAPQPLDVPWATNASKRDWAAAKNDAPVRKRVTALLRSTKTHAGHHGQTLLLNPTRFSRNIVFGEICWSFENPLCFSIHGAKLVLNFLLSSSPFRAVSEEPQPRLNCMDASHTTPGGCTPQPDTSIPPFACSCHQREPHLPNAGFLSHPRQKSLPSATQEGGGSLGLSSAVPP